MYRSKGRLKFLQIVISREIFLVESYGFLHISPLAKFFQMMYLVDLDNNPSECAKLGAEMCKICKISLNDHLRGLWPYHENYQNDKWRDKFTIYS